MIPPITDPLGRAWDQPDHSGWLFDDSHVVLPLRDFEQLREYSHSFPSGVYPGKAWKAQSPLGGWVVRWFDEHPTDPNLCRNMQRRAITVTQ